MIWISSPLLLGRNGRLNRSFSPSINLIKLPVQTAAPPLLIAALACLTSPALLKCLVRRTESGINAPHLAVPLVRLLNPFLFPTCLLPLRLSSLGKITAGPYCSAALSSSGHVYTFGCNDVNNLGIGTPLSGIPFVDNIGTQISKTSTNRDMHVCTFDSSHNVLLPARVDEAMTRRIFIRDVALGSNHMWCIGEERTEAQKRMVVGKTLYEVQEDQRMQKLHRARDSLLSKVHAQADTEGTTQTDNTEPAQEESSLEYTEQGVVVVQPAERSSSTSRTPRLSGALEESVSHPIIHESTEPPAQQGTPTTVSEPPTPASVPPSDAAASPTTMTSAGATIETKAYPNRPIRRLSLFSSSATSRLPGGGRQRRRLSLVALSSHTSSQSQPAGERGGGRQQRRRLSFRNAVPRMLRRISFGGGGGGANSSRAAGSAAQDGTSTAREDQR